MAQRAADPNNPVQNAALWPWSSSKPGAAYVVKIVSTALITKRS